MVAEAIMDLSSFGDTQKFRKKLTSECPAIIGTVPIYDAVVYYHKALKDITTQEWLDLIIMLIKRIFVSCHFHPRKNDRTAA